mmetsp:Transcript_6123/g.8808  ORF Transcript_6123/g.8808 Transcript_6123/m.8808 type:complete len:314 (+) Transcript_6123:50-991(+)|eukprot:CAMPEP_0202446114 /NCGR_PEP_ID=MMETSP1360-20130828/4735_1 /ASSEMBLY_ACC=CAM_ASM_000848 /TAXON_ID=515479 /ORGANISM="Licmophora paradoxa, Strain CCMP2313" /LENGTH=313 /DNA_ID=CAMNT_0049062549 /DNA_START=127 /DNA_END=1068 /DNA_ORIENTATION=-
MTTSFTESKNEIRVAHLGNSIQYFNDLPRLLEHMLKTTFDVVHQDSCLRGGASLPSLWREGNGMATKFHTDNARRPDGTYDIGQPTVHALLTKGIDSNQSTHDQNHHKPFDFVIMNDYTQAPARKNTMEATLEALRVHYGPLLKKQQQKLLESRGHKQITPVFVQTWAYRKTSKGSEDLGTVEQFTAKLENGYQNYVNYLRNDFGLKRTTMAPVGMVFLWMYHHRPKLWENLFYKDDFHPSPHGTWLEACVLYMTLTDGLFPPPLFNPYWFETARYMMPPEEGQLPLPTSEEAEEIRSVVANLLLETPAIQMS